MLKTIVDKARGAFVPSAEALTGRLADARRDVAELQEKHDAAMASGSATFASVDLAQKLLAAREAVAGLERSAERRRHEEREVARLEREAQRAAAIERVRELGQQREALAAAIDSQALQLAENWIKTERLAVEIAQVAPGGWQRFDEGTRLRSALLHRLQASGALPDGRPFKGPVPSVAELARDEHVVLMRQIEQKGSRQ
ncbi:MAG: hypothetical protein GEU91_19180 [Rhizobiales bacterium]|nr:hypothetical protein [Hyphomicrobiales bacterium]